MFTVSIVARDEAHRDSMPLFVSRGWSLSTRRGARHLRCFGSGAVILAGKTVGSVVVHLDSQHDCPDDVARGTSQEGTSVPIDDPIIATIDRIVFVRVRRPADAASLAPQTVEIESAARRLGRPLFACILSDDTIPPSNRQEQREATEAVTIWFRHLDGLHLVLEGDATRQSVTRMMIRTLISTARLGKKVFGIEAGDGPSRTFVHATVDEMLRQIQSQLRSSPEGIRQELRVRGML